MDWKKQMYPHEIEEYERAKEATKAAAAIRRKIYNRVRQRIIRQSVSST